MHGERILGIDPGLHLTGYGLVEPGGGRARVVEAGVVKSDEAKSTPMATRLMSIYSGLVEVLEQFQPAVVAVEQLYSHYAHPRTAILMGHARGIVFLAAAQRGLEVINYPATRIKKTITGNGHASKEQVQLTIQRELGLATVPEPPDVADALAVALCHFYLRKRP